MSLRRHLTLTLLVTFGLLLGAGGMGIYLWARLSLQREFDTALSVKLQAMSAFTVPTAEGLDLEFLTVFQHEAGVLSVPFFFEVFDAEGKSLARSTNLGAATLTPEFAQAGEMHCWSMNLPDGSRARAAAMRFTAKPLMMRARNSAALSSEKPLPSKEVVMVVAEPEEVMESELRSLASIIWTAGGLTLLATVAVVPIILRRGLTPLVRLGEQAEQMSATSLKLRFPGDKLPAELRPIMERLNDLLARLEASFERERRFSADLAHELRTPIAGLRATAEVALKFGDPADRESFQTVLDIACQMETLVSQLIALARSERAELPLREDRLLLAPLVSELWQPLTERAARRRLTIRFEVPEEAAVHTDPTLFRGVMANLLTNAADYAVEGGEIRVRWGATDGGWELTVGNSVNDLAPADVDRLFDRFWRKDQSRHDGSHAGLGLPLAQSFATLLGMELTAELNNESWLVLRLKVPERPPPSGGRPARLTK